MDREPDWRCPRLPLLTMALIQNRQNITDPIIH
jgi:hypothetical protein